MTLKLIMNCLPICQTLCTPLFVNSHRQLSSQKMAFFVFEKSVGNLSLLLLELETNARNSFTTVFRRKPNLIVHLDVTPEESMERIKQRNRSMESTISLEYLDNLKKAYDRFLHEISVAIPVIKVDWSEFQDPEKVAQLIKEEWLKMQNIHNIDFKSTHF